MKPIRGGLLGSVCIVGGVLVAVSGLLLDSQTAGAASADTTVARIANGVFAIAVLGLIGGLLGLHELRVGGPGWLARAGVVVTLLGLLLWIIGGLYLTMDASVDQPFTPAGGLISSLGMIVLGIAAIRSGVLTDWRRFVPLLVGVWFFAQIPLQIAVFISAQGSPSYALLLGVFGLLWALVGYVVRSAAGEKATRN